MLLLVISEHGQHVQHDKHIFTLSCLLQHEDEMSQGASTLKIPQRAYFQTLASFLSRLEPIAQLNTLAPYLAVHLLR